MLRGIFGQDLHGNPPRSILKGMNIAPLPDLPLFERLGGKDGIARLLRSFYADVRQHREIGPIFLARIHDWPTHIQKITEFWSRVTGGPSTFDGDVPGQHLPLGLERAHFDRWLELWDYNCQRHLKPREAAEMSALAHNIGRRLNQLVGKSP
jgi:hemoglobin